MFPSYVSKLIITWKDNRKDVFICFFYTFFSLLFVVGIPAALRLDQKSRTAKSQSSAGLKNYLSSNTRNSFNLFFYFKTTVQMYFYYWNPLRLKNRPFNKVATPHTLFGTQVDGKILVSYIVNCMVYLFYKIDIKW